MVGDALKIIASELTVKIYFPVYTVCSSLTILVTIRNDDVAL
jgi:hypothetical protein